MTGNNTNGQPLPPGKIVSVKQEISHGFIGGEKGQVCLTWYIAQWKGLSPAGETDEHCTVLCNLSREEHT